MKKDDNLTGKLRHKITIKHLQSVDDGAGGSVETWMTYASPFASVEPLSGRELFQAQQLQSEVTHKIRMRYRPGITPDMRVYFGTRVFLINSAINWQERNRELTLMCVEVQNPD
ncbi:phage head closure protein [Paenibacillus sp. Pae108]|uniref:phage head closure protein n=1 Tax=Paenibacillus sp. Pae108 TaxID=2926019 RepID=UPI0021173BB3|nr:phage head closure protein [Paenibacillus sp. Pae108]